MIDSGAFAQSLLALSAGTLAGPMLLVWRSAVVGQAKDAGIIAGVSAVSFVFPFKAALQALDTPFAAVDVLPDPRIRQELSAISDWPTIPQLFANGELVGGCDIVCEMYESGELQEALQ